MKAHLLLALVAVGALALPAAAAHIVIAYPVHSITTVPPTFVRCDVTSVGSPSLFPHATFWIQPCPPPVHALP